MHVYNRKCVCIAWIFKIKTFKNHHFLEENRDPLWIFFSVIFLTIHMGFCSFPDPKTRHGNGCNGRSDLDPKMEVR